jgi:hypothetical protein
MSKFDLIYEKALISLKEQDQQIVDSLDSHIMTLVNRLQTSPNKYLSKNVTAKDKVREIKQNSYVLHIGSDEMTYLPRIKLEFGQTEGTEDFDVVATVEQAKSNAISETKKVWKGEEFPESIADDVIAFLDKVSLEVQTGDGAVQSTPEERGAGAQPGAEGTALPVAANNQPGAGESELPAV